LILLQNSAILRSACASKTYTAAHWSMTRPAVFFLGTKTGNVEVGNRLDRCVCTALEPLDVCVPHLSLLMCVYRT